MILLLLLALTTGAAAAGTEEEDVFSRQSAALDTESVERAVPSGARELLGGAGVSDKTGLEEGLAGLWERAKGELSSLVKRGVRSAVLLMAIVLLCGVAGAIYESGASGGVANYVPLVGTLAVTAVAVGDVHTLIGLGSETIGQIDTFSKALLPTLAAATAASGNITGAAARQVATVFFSDMVLTVINRFLLPLVYAYIAAQAANAAVDNDVLGRVASLLKWVINTVLAVTLIAFIGYLSVSGAIAGSADAMTVKAAKFAVSGAVPVVGGILSDAAETVLVGAGILKNTVGVFGMLAVLAICIIPFLRLGIQYLVYKLTAAVAATIGDGRVVKLIDGIGGAFGMVLGMTGTCALVLLISIVSSIKAVVP